MIFLVFLFNKIIVRIVQLANKALLNTLTPLLALSLTVKISSIIIASWKD